MRRALLLLFVLGALACKQSSQHEPPKKVVTAPEPPLLPADDRYDTGALGALTFKTASGNAEARGHFIRGLLALHSFWYDEAQREFEAAIAADKGMVMAHWGLAMSHVKLLWGDDDIVAARTAMAALKGAKTSNREHAWLEATAALLAADDVPTSRRQFAAAMQVLNDKYPDDETATFLAIASLATIGPDNPDSMAARGKAADLAGKVFAHNPKHPGAAHYLIHAYDTPELAALALPAARAYASIAPAAFHARHMPAHIFSRLGMWQDAIASCRSAWDVSVAAAQREHLDANHHDFHSLNWLVEMNFELGHRKEADAALAQFAAAVKAGLEHRQRSVYAVQVSSYMARTGEWSRVDELLAPLAAPATDADAPPPTPPGANARPGDPAAAHCAPPPASSPVALFERLGIAEAHARAAAMQHQLPATRKYLAELDTLRAQLAPLMAPGRSPEDQKRSDDAQGRRKAVFLAFAANDDRALLAALRAAVADIPRDVGGESNPTGIILEEEIADTLLRLGNVLEAGPEYERVLKKNPNRAHALLGLARAAAKAGKPDVARATYQKLAAQWQTADDTTPGLAEVRAGAK